MPFPMPMLRNAARIARRRVVVCDISEDYASTPLMRTGEPYLLDYQRLILGELAALSATADVRCVVLHRPIRGRLLLAVVELFTEGTPG